MRELELCIPDTSYVSHQSSYFRERNYLRRWTAVVRGAAIFGIEKSTDRTLTAMTACPRSYGVAMTTAFSDITHSLKDLATELLTNTAVAKGQLEWLIKKGDLIMSNKSKEVNAGPFNINFTETASRKGTIPIYAYDGDNIPDRLSNSENGSTTILILELKANIARINTFS